MNILGAAIGKLGGNVVKTGYIDDKGAWREMKYGMPFVDPAKYPPGSRGFGVKFHPIDQIWKMHTGQDFACPEGTPIIPIADGIIHSKGYDETNGNFVRVRHPDGIISGYAHLQTMVDILNGTKVDRETIIGLTGNTGHSQVGHLHLTTWLVLYCACIDPMLLLK